MPELRASLAWSTPGDPDRYGNRLGDFSGAQRGGAQPAVDRPDRVVWSLTGLLTFFGALAYASWAHDSGDGGHTFTCARRTDHGGFLSAGELFW